jgi:ferredoxin
MQQTHVFSSYVITDPCIGVKDGTCVEVCPVDCIETTPESDQFFIDPTLCIACEQCVLVCPVDVIFLEHEVPEPWNESIERNAAFFLKAKEDLPVVTQEQAAAIISGAQERAAELGIEISIAIVDKGGDPVSEVPATGGGPDGQASALDKASSSVAMEISTAQINDRMVENAPAGIDASRLVTESGGIPFGRPWVIGAVGVSGGEPEQDIECSRAGVTAGRLVTGGPTLA